MDLKKKMFDSPEDCAAFMAQVPHNLQFREQLSWGGSVDTCIEKLNHGDTTYVEEAEKILSQINDLGVQTPKARLLSPALAGYMPNIPAYLAGQPFAMFNKTPSELDDPVTPINVYIECQVSAGVTNYQLLKRGIATLALVMALEQRRPVDLWVGGGEPNQAGTHTVITFTKIASRPLDLGRACYMLVDHAFARAGMFTLLAGIDEARETGHWAFGGPTKSGYEAKWREALELEPHDVFLQGGHLHDSLMLSDPVAWVNLQLDKQDKITDGDDTTNEE